MKKTKHKKSRKTAKRATKGDVSCEVSSTSASYVAPRAPTYKASRSPNIIIGRR